MRRFFGIFIFIVLGFLLGFGVREVQGEIRAKREAKERKFSYATAPVLEEKAFVVLIFEGEGRSEETLLTALNQEYDAYRVIYFGSENSAAKLFLKNYDLEGKVTYVESHKEKSELVYRAVHAAESKEIVVMLGGGDSFSSRQVLSTLNKHFADSDVWMLSSQTLHYPTYEKTWNPGYFQAFYAGLAKQIRLETFLMDGAFTREHYEKVLFPRLSSVAGSHAYQMKEPLFISGASRALPLMDEEGTYAPAKEYPWHDASKDEERVDLLVFSYNRPLQLYAFLESSEKYLENLHRMFVIYRAGNDHYEKGYKKVKEAFPNVIYMKQSVDHPSEDFAPTVQKALFDRDISSARFVTFAFDDFVLKEEIDLQEAACLLKETGAYGFYFCLGNNLQNHPQEEKKILIQEGIYGWQFSTMEGAWRVPNSVRMTLFKKEEIAGDFLYMKYHNPNLLEALWSEKADLSRIGLYYDRSKALSLPLNLTVEGEGIEEKVSKMSTKELLTLFDQGLKMDITSIQKVDNRAIDLSIKPTFIQRQGDRK